MLTEKGKGTARDCLSHPGLGDSEEPLMTTSIHNTSTGPAAAETMSGTFMTIRRSRTSVARHSSKHVWDSSPKKVESSYKDEVQTKCCTEGTIFLRFRFRTTTSKRQSSESRGCIVAIGHQEVLAREQAQQEGEKGSGCDEAQRSLSLEEAGLEEMSGLDTYKCASFVVSL